MPCRCLPKFYSLSQAFAVLAGLALASACDSKRTPEKPTAEPATTRADEKPKPPPLAPKESPTATATPLLTIGSDEACQGLLGRSVFDIFFPDRAEDFDQGLSSSFMDGCVLTLATHSNDGVTFESLTLGLVNAEEYDGVAAKDVFNMVTRPGRVVRSDAALARTAEFEKTADKLLGKGGHDVNAQALANETIERETTLLAGLGTAGALVQERITSNGGGKTTREVYFVVQDTVFYLRLLTSQDGAALTRAAKLIAPRLAKLPKPAPRSAASLPLRADP